MSSVNKVFILGHLGKDPEKFDQLVTASVATTEVWKDKVTGEKREATEWHRIVFLGKLADISYQWLKKGSRVYIEGSLHTQKYTDKEGIEKYSTGVRAHILKILDKKSDSNSAPNPYAQASMSSTTPATTVYSQLAPSLPPDDDDVPF